MKKAILISLLFCVGCANEIQAEKTSDKHLEIDAFGPDVHMNQYGQPVILKPDWGGVPREYLEIESNGYGLGVHIDQYGRPVREYPWP